MKMRDTWLAVALMLGSMLLGALMYHTMGHGPESSGPAGFPVIRIVDGDTFDVTAAGKPMRIRIAAIDTPERGEPGFGEATEYLRQLIEGKNVRLSYEDIKPRRWIFGYPVGPFGRLLAHPHVDVDGGELDVGQEMIDSGHARRWRKRKGKTK